MLGNFKPPGKEPKNSTAIVIAATVVAIVGLVVASGYRGSFKVYAPPVAIDGSIEIDRGDTAK